MTYKVARLEREPAYLKVCQALEQDILEGRLPVGNTLPTESDLADQFGVNRSTVREGVRLLEQTGLITRGAAKRWVVKQLCTSDVASTTSRAMARSGVTFLQAWEALSVIYPEAAGLVAERATTEILLRMQQRVSLESNLADDQHDMLVVLVLEFFGDIVEAVENPALQVPLESINLLLASSLQKILHATPDALPRIIRAQEELIDAFKQKDKDKAALWMRRHIEDLKRGYLVAGIDINTKIL